MESKRIQHPVSILLPSQVLNEQDLDDDFEGTMRSVWDFLGVPPLDASDSSVKV